MFKGHFKTGTVEGTAAAINVQLGFAPSYVKLYNIDDAGTLFATLEWTSDMESGKGFKTLKIADSGSTGNLSCTYIASGGITPYAGTTGGNAIGFTIGTDADINAAAETICYVAFGGEA